MRKTVINCDRCGHEIEGDPYKIITEQVDKESGDWLDPEAEEQLDGIKDIPKMDFCKNCMETLIEIIRGELWKP